MQSYHRILMLYERELGEAINFQKSGIFFSTNVSTNSRDLVTSILGVQSHLNIGRYLGLSSLIGKSKREVFGLLKDRLRSRTQGWQNKLLSQAGNEIIIKVVSQAIPSYCMSTFLLPKTMADKLQKMMNSFWWGTKLDGTRSINWTCWNTMCRGENEGRPRFQKPRRLLWKPK